MPHAYFSRGSYIQGERYKIGPRRWCDRRHLGTVDGAIECVAFYGDAPGGADEALEFGARCELGSFRASVVVNLFFDNRAVQIVRSEAQSDLRDARRKHDPIRLDVVEIIEKQARDGNVTKIGIARRLRNVRERGVIRMQRQRNEGHKAVRFIL